MRQAPSEHGFLLLHGWQNRRPAEHWQHWLTDQLTGLGYQVGYPQLPDPDYPDLEQWLAELRGQLISSRPRSVICHSLSCLLWLHAAAHGLLTVPVDRVLLVAPPAPAVLARHPEIAGFAAPEITREQLSAAAFETRILAADNDPYCQEGAAVHYGRPLGVRTEIVPGGAHLDLAAGYGPWPTILQWCRDPDSAIGIHPA